jgi:predicted phage tail protein
MKPACHPQKRFRFLCVCAAAIALQACGNGADNDTASTSARDIEAPTAPTELAARAASSSSIDLNWIAAMDNVGVVAYRVYRSDAASFVASVTSTTYADAGLAADTEYHYTVRAVDAAGNESAASNIATTATLSAPVVEGANASTSASSTWRLPPDQEVQCSGRFFVSCSSRRMSV